MTTVLPLVLFTASALATWAAVLTHRRRPAPGASALFYLVVAAGWWCLTEAFQTLAGPLPAKIVWAKLQYVGIAAVPPMWLLFTAKYADAGWTTRRGLRAGLGVAALFTVVASVTNEWHHALWTSVELTASGAAVYQHGVLFWGINVYSHVLVFSGTLLLLGALRRSPRPLRGQSLAMIVAGVLPWTGNLFYVAGLTPAGVDATPLAFAVSALLFTSAFYRNRLLDLVPVARDVVIESLSDAVIVLDAARRIVDMNAAARQLAGQPNRWAGLDVATLLPALRDVRLDATADSSTMLAMTSEQGATRYFDLRVILVRTREERAAAWVALMRDVSDQLRAEAERAALETRVQEQQKRESLSVLAGGLAHDFNNLLTGIVGNADLLSLQIPASSELGNNVGAILLGAQRAADLVDKMLAYAGERHGSTDRVNLDELIRDMVDLLRASAARHCTLRYEGLPAMIEADPTQIRQVVMNLIINAADAVDESTGTIDVVTGVESLTGDQLGDVDAAPDAVAGEYAYLDVTDNGVGMDDVTLARIFEPFYTTKPTGHGLGLAAVLGIVHGHHGALRVESQRGSGSRFRVWFPLAAPDQAPPCRSSKSASPSAPVMISKS